MSLLGENILLKSELRMNVDICVKLGRVKQKQQQKQTKYFRHGFNKGNLLSFWWAKTTKVMAAEGADEKRSNSIWPAGCLYLSAGAHHPHCPLYWENWPFSVWTTEELFLILSPFLLLHQVPVSTSVIGVQVKTFIFPFWFFISQQSLKSAEPSLNPSHNGDWGM